MKTEFVDVNETRKNVRVEISSEVVDAEIDRQARDYSRKARIPGFRPGKAPARVIKRPADFACDPQAHGAVHAAARGARPASGARRARDPYTTTTRPARDC